MRCPCKGGRKYNYLEGCVGHEVNKIKSAKSLGWTEAMSNILITEKKFNGLV